MQVMMTTTKVHALPVEVKSARHFPERRETHEGESTNVWYVVMTQRNAGGLLDDYSVEKETRWRRRTARMRCAQDGGLGGVERL